MVCVRIQLSNYLLMNISLYGKSSTFPRLGLSTLTGDVMVEDEVPGTDIGAWPALGMESEVA